MWCQPQPRQVMAVNSAPSSSSSTSIITAPNRTHFLAFPKHHHHPINKIIPFSPTNRVLAMAPKQKVNKYDSSWKKQWYGAGIFFEGSEEVEVDVFKKLEKRRVLSNLEKAGLLSKAEQLGLTLSSIENLRLFSKAEDLRLLSLLEKAASASPSALASAALPALLAALAALLLIPDDSAALVALQGLLAAALATAAAGLFIGSILLGALQEAD